MNTNIEFTLSMPNSPSWNGKWSGEGKVYAIVRAFSGKKGAEKAQKILDVEYFSHSWSDGWRAEIRAQKVDGKTAAQFRKRSQGFCGYDWMVRNILDHGSTYNAAPVKSDTVNA